MRVAIVHEWLASYAGSERAVEQMLEVYPQADVFSVADLLTPEGRAFLGGRPVRSTFIRKLPLAASRYRDYLPLMPLAVEQIDLSGYDLVISSSHAVAKGVLTGPDQLHVCYCYSPIRYAWDLQHQYLNESGLARGLKGAAVRALLHYVRLWDARTANGVDHFMAISGYIARRVWKAYRRSSRVIYPPVDVAGFAMRADKEDFYLTVSRMVPYKRMDLIVAAFSRTPERRLVVIGDGPDMAKVRALAGPNVTLLGHQPEPVLRDHLQRARAFVFAAEEDFGIAPVEAQSCGTPVIAFGRGGATETVLEHETGLFFGEQTAESLLRAVDLFEATAGRLGPQACRRNAERFSAPRFREEFGAHVQTCWDEFEGGRRRDSASDGRRLAAPQAPRGVV